MGISENAEIPFQPFCEVHLTPYFLEKQPCYKLQLFLGENAPKHWHSEVRLIFQTLKDQLQQQPLLDVHVNQSLLILHFFRISYEYPYLTFKAKVSKGTYIRTLGSDIAKKLNTVGYLTFLASKTLKSPILVLVNSVK